MLALLELIFWTGFDQLSADFWIGHEPEDVFKDRVQILGGGRVKSSDVNCEPWSVLKIFGLPKRSSASTRASTQKLGSSVFDSLHDKTYLEYQSMIATRYMNPYRMGM